MPRREDIIAALRRPIDLPPFPADPTEEEKEMEDMVKAFVARFDAISDAIALLLANAPESL